MLGENSISFQQDFNEISTRNLDKTDKISTRNLDEILVDPDAEGYSINEMAKKLSIAYGTLNSQLRKAKLWPKFRSQCRKLSDKPKTKQVYSCEAWLDILNELGHKLPDCVLTAQAQPKNGQSSALTIPVVEAEFVDPMDEYMASALAFSDGAKPLAHRDTSLDVTQLQALAANATTAMNDFTNLLTEEEIQEAINRGAKRGAMKAALERQSEVKVYEASMGGKLDGEQSPQSA